MCDVPAKIRLLLIDDDENDHVLIRRMLSDVALARYEIVWAKTCEKALEALDADLPDACLLDYHLGPMSGLELLDRIARRPGAPPTIVLTDHSDYADDLEAMRNGAADYLVKHQLNKCMLERAIRYCIERRRARDHASESEKQLRLLSSKLLEIQENERRKVAAELHDNLGQLLPAFKFGVERVLTSMDPGDRRHGELQMLVPLVQDAIEVVRGIYTQLTPIVLEDLGITAALSCFCREFEEANPQIAVHRYIGLGEEEIPDGLKLIIFRIVQEAMDNIAVHSNANNVSIALFPDSDTLTLAIRDNGSGFDVGKVMSGGGSKSGIGLISIRRRAELSGGAFDIDSTAGEGTLLKVFWPCF